MTPFTIAKIWLSHDEEYQRLTAYWGRELQERRRLMASRHDFTNKAEKRADGVAR